jgi:hypothetical protein
MGSVGDLCLAGVVDICLVVLSMEQMIAQAEIPALP